MSRNTIRSASLLLVALLIVLAGCDSSHSGSKKRFGELIVYNDGPRPILVRLVSESELNEEFPEPTVPNTEFESEALPSGAAFSFESLFRTKERGERLLMSLYTHCPDQNGAFPSSESVPLIHIEPFSDSLLVELDFDVVIGDRCGAESKASNVTPDDFTVVNSSDEDIAVIVIDTRSAILGDPFLVIPPEEQSRYLLTPGESRNYSDLYWTRRMGDRVSILVYMHCPVRLEAYNLSWASDDDMIWMYMRGYSTVDIAEYDFSVPAFPVCQPIDPDA